MWFDPTAIVQPSQLLATLAIPATFTQRTGEETPKVAEVAEVAAPMFRENETACYRWLIHFADRNPLTVAFSPSATHAEVLDAYPAALAAEPIAPGRRQPDTPLAAGPGSGSPGLAGADRRKRSGDH